MKKIFLLVLLFCSSLSVAGGIYSNETGIDTVAFPFAVIDSAGNGVVLASGDTVYVVVFSPDGSNILNQTLLFNDSKINNIRTSYVYTNLLSTVIASGSGTYGVYGYGIEVWDNSLSLRTQFGGVFQVVGDRYNDFLENLDEAISGIDDNPWDDVTRTLTSPTFPTNFADLAITATTGYVTAGTVNDKTGYSLTQSFPTNFADLAITATTGLVDINGKTGFSLLTSEWTTLKSDLSTAHGSGSWEAADLTEVEASLDTLLKWPDGNVLTSSKTNTGTTADTIWYWYNDVYVGRMILLHQAGVSTPDTAFFQTAGP